MFFLTMTSPPQGLYQEFKSQYQTSLGLGASFATDTFQVTRRQRQRRRNHRFYQGSRSQGLSTEQTAVLRSSGDTLQNAAPSSPIRGRGTGEFYGYLNGTFHRETACRFLLIIEEVATVTEEGDVKCIL